MRPDQKEIYYINGSSVENIDNSPQVEGFKTKDIEVLYLCDTVDDFWVTATNKYKDYQFKSITRSDIDIDNLNPTNDNRSDLEFDDDKKNIEGKEKLKDVTESNYEDLIKFFKSTLENCNLKDVKISKKLTSSPVCLVADERGMDIKLERFLLEQKQIVAPLPKILEINPNHYLLKIIQENLSNKDRFEEIQDIIKTLFDEACILEGEPVKNPSDFANRLNKLMRFE